MAVELNADWSLGRWAAGPLGHWATYDECTSFCRYMKMVRFHSTELPVCKPYWLVDFFLFLIMFMFLQGGRAFALKIAHQKNLELRKLAAHLAHLWTTER